jgi:hypothetical protein
MQVRMSLSALAASVELFKICLCRSCPIREQAQQEVQGNTIISYNSTWKLWSYPVKIRGGH